MSSYLKNYYPIFLILVFAAVLLSINLNKPFIGHHDWNGAFWGEITKRYLSINSDTNIKTLFFLDYTPLLPLLFVFFSKVFGLSEFTLRMVPAIFSLVMIFFIYKIGQLIFGKTTGLFSAVFAAVTPMFLYFGKIPDHEPIATSLITAAFYFYLKAFGSNSKNKFLFLIFLFFSLLESWPAFFLIPPLIIFSLMRKAKISEILTPVTLAIMVIIFHLSSIIYIYGMGGLLNFFKQGYLRANSGTELIGGFSNYSSISFITTEAHYAVIYFTRILIVFSAFWVIDSIVKVRQKKISQGQLSLFILLIYPLSFVLIFRQLAFIHDYKLYHFLPFISLSAAAILNDFFKALNFEKIKIPIFMIIATLVFLERLNYLGTLLKTSFNTPGYELGLLIKQKTQPQESVLVNSAQFKAFFDVFVSFYSDRNVDYQDIKLDDFESESHFYQKYKYVILIDGRDTDPNILSYLENTYNFDKFGPYRFFDISSRI